MVHIVTCNCSSNVIQFIPATGANYAIIHATSLKLSRFVCMLQILLLLLLLLPHIGLLQHAKFGRDARYIIDFGKPSCESSDFRLKNRINTKNTDVGWARIHKMNTNVGADRTE